MSTKRIAAIFAAVFLGVVLFLAVAIAVNAQPCRGCRQRPPVTSRYGNCNAYSRQSYRNCKVGQTPVPNGEPVATPTAEGDK